MECLPNIHEALGSQTSHKPGMVVQTRDTSLQEVEAAKFNAVLRLQPVLETPALEKEGNMYNAAKMPVSITGEKDLQLFTPVSLRSL